MGWEGDILNKAKWLPAVNAVFAVTPCTSTDGIRISYSIDQSVIFIVNSTGEPLLTVEPVNLRRRYLGMSSYFNLFDNHKLTFLIIKWHKTSQME